MFKLFKKNPVYDTLSCTSFPKSEDTIKMIKEYEQCFADGNLNRCNELLNSNTILKNQMDSAEQWNKLYDAMISAQKILSGHTLDRSVGLCNHPHNCVNCGAPLSSGQCEYCGTRY